MFITLCVAAGVATANPIVTNKDRTSYTLQLECKVVGSDSRMINPGDTLELMAFREASDCRVNIYPWDKPYDKEGNYDPKKRLSSSRVKRVSECVIKKGRITCASPWMRPD